MVEYDRKVCEKIYGLLKKYDYERFFYNKINKRIEIFNNQEVFNIFFINKLQKKLIYDHS